MKGEPGSLEYYIEKHSLRTILDDPLLSALRIRRLESSQTLFREQERISFLYLLVEGRVRCAHYHTNGTLAVVDTMEPFQALGDVELYYGQLSTTAVISTEDTVLLEIPVAVVHREGMDDPAFLRFMVSELTDKLMRSTSLRLGHLLPVKSRLALYLLTGAGGEQVVILPEKDVLASLIGTTYRHLNRTLAELIDEGCIGSAYPGVRIRDREALNRILDH
jgi:CRP-like cAMP-binding protein